MFSATGAAPSTLTATVWGPTVSQVACHAACPLAPTTCSPAPSMAQSPLAVMETTDPESGTWRTTPSAPTDAEVTCTTSDTGAPMSGGLGDTAAWTLVPV